MNGNKLKKLRESKGILQKELAQELCVKTSTIGMYEQGRREPDNSMLKKIANFFEVSIDYLLDNNISNKEEEKIREIEALKKLLVDIGYMKNNEDLTDEELKNLIEFVKTNKKYIKECK